MTIRQYSRDGSFTFHIQGKFTFEMHREFRKAYTDAIAANPKSIELNLSEVDYLDSSALGMMLLFREQVIAKNIATRLVGCRGVVKDILMVANFNKLFNMV